MDLDEGAYEAAKAARQAYCPTEDDLTGYEIPPHLETVPWRVCPRCGMPTMMGVEAAAVSGLVRVYRESGGEEEGGDEG